MTNDFFKQAFSGLCEGLVILLFLLWLLVLIFGGEISFHVKINWHSAVDLWKVLVNK